MSRTLGPYQVHSELGRGAMAVVWRAHDSVLERDVAIKEPLLPQGLDALASAEFGARFVREAKAAARLNHPNIVTIYAADIYDGHPAIVMELIEGQTLGQLLERGPLDKQLAIHVLEQLLSGVGYAHERGIVHRDIKPDNVFVTPDGRVKLADFGIASLASDSTLTQAGAIMGTPGYMAPEQITGDPVDARADIFACGVLAYEMLTGQNPFGATDGTPATTVMYRIVHQAPPELPAEALAGLPAHLSAVLGAALAKAPADRFPDAASFLAALGGQGSLPVPGLGTTAGAAQGMGTMLRRMKSATMISRGPGKPQEPTWLRSWVPYAAVVGIGLIIMIALLVSARGGGGLSASTSDTTSTETSGGTWSTVGTSRQGNAIEMLSAGSGAWRVLVIGGIHGNEQGAPVGRAFASYVEDNPDVVPAGTQLRVITNVNPDGRKAWTRGNAYGVDLNRNFPTQNWQGRLNSKDAASRTCNGGSSPGSEPETQAILSCLEDGFDVVIAFYSPGGYIDYDGSASGYSIALRMSQASGMRLDSVKSQPYITGSLGTYVPERYGKPVISITLADDSRLTGPVLQALLAALQPN